MDEKRVEKKGMFVFVRCTATANAEKSIRKLLNGAYAPYRVAYDMRRGKFNKMVVTGY